MQPGDETIGFVGLGVMGAPMAQNLVRAGFDVVGFTRSSPALRQLEASGGHIATSVTDVAERCGAVITMLPDDSAVRTVYLDGLLPSVRPEAVLVDMSTVSPMLSCHLAQLAEQAGAFVLDAPVSGGEQGAIAGSLSIMVGGEAQVFDRLLGVFRALGTTVNHVGPSGAGQTVKAANQLLVGGIIELVSEAIVFLEAHAISLGPALEVLAGGLAGNRILDRKVAGMVSREFRPGFRVDLHHKDMQIVLAAARDADVALPLAAIVAQLFIAARGRGDGALDHTALLRTVEALSGRGDLMPDRS